MAEQERAIRDRIIVAVGSDDWTEMFVPPKDEQYKDEIPQIRFLTAKQMAEAENGGYPPTAEIPTTDDSDEAYEQLFEIPIHGLLRWAIIEGYLDTLPPQQRDAIQTYARLVR